MNVVLSSVRTAHPTSLTVFDIDHPARAYCRYQHTHEGVDRTEDMIVRAERRRVQTQEYRRRIRPAAGLS
jgi:hypothetical protein